MNTRSGRKTKHRVVVNKYNLTNSLPDNILPEDSIKTDIENVVRVAFKHLANSVSYEISVILTSNEYIKTLNKKYLNKDIPTDVLCFPYSTGRLKQADIFVSVQMAKVGAARAGHALRQEILFLVLHGVLHLLGWRDRNTTQRKKMWGKQTELLSMAGCI